MLELHFLDQPDNLSQQVTDFLIQNVAADTAALKKFLLITPTAGAGRSVNRLLGASGLPTVANVQPMAALLPDRSGIATSTERALAWVQALQASSEATLRPLFWKRRPEAMAELLKASRNFIKLCDQLIEGGNSPVTLAAPSALAGSFEEGRWSVIAELYRHYTAILSSWELKDPNEVRLAQIETPECPFDSVVIAGVPDLPRAFEGYLERLENSDKKIDLLVWNPARRAASDFDDYGRPIPECWMRRELAISEAQIHLCASAQDEANLVAMRAIDPETNLVSIDIKQNTQIASSLNAQGRSAHLPEGTPLIQSEAARVATGWETFKQNQDLRILRGLLESPAFCRALDPENRIYPKQALAAIDQLLGKTISSTLEDAWAASPPLPDGSEEREKVSRARIRRLLGSVRERQSDSPLQILEAMFPDEEQRPISARRVLEIGYELADSPASRTSGANARQAWLSAQFFTQAIRDERILTPASSDATTLNGWLEAPWLNGKSILISGLTEGAIPQNIEGDPFLPDSIRPSLRLNSNEQRLARDTYLLDALTATYPEQALNLCLSKFTSDGDPKKPSRLLFRTPLGELPNRTLHLTKPQARSTKKPRRQTSWKWRLPDPPKPVEKISPTQFSSYLACPFRFFLGKVMKYEDGPKPAREMDAAVFGNLIHKSLEDFGLEAIRDDDQMLKYTEQHIHDRVQFFLKKEAEVQFGPNPTPAVKVQLANAKARLHAYAGIQAACFADGWKILAVERKLSAGSASPLEIGGLKLSGVIDRIERNESTGALRVMDFKTFSSPKKPAETHLSPPSHNWLNEALVELDLGNGPKSRTWANLQLPLYRRILEHWYPEDCARESPTTAYFVLPSDPSDSGIYPFEELESTRNPQAYQSAIKCAEAVAQQIKQGHFWPPQIFRGSWEDPVAPLLVNGSLEDTVHPDTIDLLRGGSK